MCLVFEIWKLLSKRQRRINWSILEVSTSRADERNWQLRTDLSEKVGLGESSIFPQDRWSWCWFFFIVSWSLQKASGVHHVVVPRFGRCRSGGACLDTCKVKRKQGQVWDVWDMAASAAGCASHWGAVSWSQRKGKQATLQIWRRIMDITGQETLMWMSGLWNMSVRVGNTVSLSLMHTSSWSIPCTSLHGIKI